MGQDGVWLPGPARAKGESCLPACPSVCLHGYREVRGGVLGQEARGETQYLLESLTEAALGTLNPSVSSTANV